MQDNRSQSVKWQRYEAKYLISKRQAAEVRRYCLDHLPPDPHSSCAPSRQYPILSVYLDSPARALLRHTLDKHPNRYKLRVRRYCEYTQRQDDLLAFLEIKHRINGIMQKTRARVRPEVADSLLWNKTAAFDGRGSPDRATHTNMSEFLHLRRKVGARPVVGIYYTREAYEAASAERVRITLDRKLHCGILAPSGNARCDMWWPADPGGVILEVKFTNTYPFWVANLLHRLEVQRRGVCKYVICSRAAGVSAAVRDAARRVEEWTGSMNSSSRLARCPTT